MKAEGGADGRIKILMTVADLYGGGTEKMFANLCRGLSREKFDIHVCLWRDLRRHALPEGVPVYVLDKNKPRHAPRTVVRLARLIREIRRDIVYSALRFTNILTGEALAVARVNTPRALRISNSPPHELTGPMKWWAKRTYGRADLCIPVSAGVADSAREYLGLDPDKVKVIHNIVNTERLDKLAAEPTAPERPPGAFVVAHAGRMCRQKNQRLLLEAFARMKTPQAVLWFLGEGKLEASLKKYARELGVDDRIEWPGFRNNPFPYIKNADVFALSSDYEGLPNVLIESAVLQTPAVSTRCGHGPDEIIKDGETGLLTPTGDAGALADALDRLAEDPDRRIAMGRAARKAAMDKFNADVIIGRFEEAFEDLARIRGKSRG